MSHEAIKALQAGLLHMLKTESHSDLVLYCEDGRTFNVHKAILCAQSNFFRLACKPEQFKEGQQSLINIIIGDSPTIKLMLDCIYTLDYSDAFTSDGPFLCNAKMLEAADFYDIPILQTLAAAKFAQAAEEKWSSDYFLDAISHIYCLAPSSLRLLRGVVIDIAYENRAVLGTIPAFWEMVNAIPEFERDLMDEGGTSSMQVGKREGSGKMRRVVCGLCRFGMVVERREVILVCPCCEVGGPGLFEEVGW